jgi:hypothetical protein
MIRLHAFLGACLVVLAAAPPARAQVVRGAVKETASEAVVPGAAVSLVDSAGAVVASTATSDEGLFLLRAPGPGTYRVRAGRIGYATVTSDPFRVEPDDDVFADLCLAILPVPQEAIELSVEARDPRLERTGFYKRQERNFGFFVTREEIDRRSPQRITDLFFGYPGVHVLYAGAAGKYEVVMRGARSMFLGGSRGRPDEPGPATTTCFPTVTVDGVVVRRGGSGVEIGEWNHLVHPQEIEAIEVYTSSSGLPPELAGNNSPCGAILIWMRWK